MSAPRFKISTFLLGAAGGAGIALIYLWAVPFTFRGLLGVLVGGAVTGIAFATGASLVRRWSDLALYTGAAAAGAIGGAAWWLVVRPPTTTVFWAALIGALLVAFMVVVEDRLSTPRLR